MTLIEVIAGLTLMAILLAIATTSFRQHAAQVHRAADVREAVNVADDLLAHWFGDPSTFPRRASGIVGEGRTMRWQTEVQDKRWHRPLGIEIVRLTLYGNKTGHRLREDDVLFTVDVAVVDPRWRPDPVEDVSGEGDAP
jgi:hypothetical protein